MIRKANSLFWAVMMLSTTPGIAAAAADVFMCVDGITGSSIDEQFAGCSEIFGVSYSVGIVGDPPPLTGGGHRPQPTCGLYLVTKVIDDGSIPIMIRSLVGRSSAEVEFAIRTRADEPVVFLQLVLRGVLILEVEQDLDSGADLPVEKIVMRPSEVEWRFTPQADGTPGAPVAGGYDCIVNRPL